MAKQVSKTEVKMANEKNTDELALRKVKEKGFRSNMTASDFRGVDFAYSDVGTEMIRQTNVLIKLMEKTFGTSQLMPEITAVPKMFNQLMQEKQPEDYIPVLEDFKTHTVGSLNDLLKAKYKYEKNTHKNQNDYKKTCITGGSGLETAKVNWEFAVDSFEEDKQDAEATLKEAIYASRKAHKEIYSPKKDLESKISYNVDYFSEAYEVATAIDSYGKTMEKANTALTTAFAALLSAFNKNSNLIAAGELKLISENRKDSKDLWVSIQSNYQKK